MMIVKFISVSRIIDNEDDVFIFSRNVRKQHQKYYEILTI